MFKYIDTMKNNILYTAVLAIVILFVACNNNAPKEEAVVVPKYKVMVITGQNNHQWKVSSKVFKTILDESALFSADIVTSPKEDKDMSAFNPNFSAYDVVVMDYNGDSWNDSTKTAFINYVSNGGGLVVYHAADNSFPEWKEFNLMAGLGGWGDRNEESGPYVYWKDGKIVRDNSEGKGGGHGARHMFKVVTRQPEHPIMKGMPEAWIHTKDELYDKLRGPAENMTVLATAYSDTATRGTGKHEPILMTIDYNKGRVFHTVLGHADKKDNQAMQCAGFITTFLRGCEWAASGEVNQAIPTDLPNVVSYCMWEDYVELTINELVQKASEYKIGYDLKYVSDFKRRIRKCDGSKEAYSEFEQAMIQAIETGATTDAINHFCRELSWMGSKKCKSTLKKLAKNEDTSDMANYALDRL